MFFENIAIADTDLQIWSCITIGVIVIGGCLILKASFSSIRNGRLSTHIQAEAERIDPLVKVVAERKRRRLRKGLEYIYISQLGSTTTGAFAMPFEETSEERRGREKRDAIRKEEKAAKKLLDSTPDSEIVSSVPGPVKNIKRTRTAQEILDKLARRAAKRLKEGKDVKKNSGIPAVKTKLVDFVLPEGTREKYFEIVENKNSGNLEPFRARYNVVLTNAYDFISAFERWYPVANLQSTGNLLGIFDHTIILQGGLRYNIKNWISDIPIADCQDALSCFEKFDNNSDTEDEKHLKVLVLVCPELAFIYEFLRYKAPLDVKYNRILIQLVLILRNDLMKKTEKKE